VTLELGGKDPAYVAADANISAAAKSLVDGACYNAGQSCCGVERIYVHESKYEEFLDEAKTHFEAYHLGDPFDHKTNMGPMALKDAPKLLDDHVKDAIAKGARTITRYGITTDAKGKGRFYTPTLLADCDHSMKVMLDESFGPIVGVASVLCDEEAIIKMNDSAYGLTAAVFTSNKERAMRLGQQLSAGTIYMNRCDALDPYIPWTGVRDSGKGVSLSKHGFRALTKLKSVSYIAQTT
jgi:acyl-CoA reductase-like NAD-dependent aldehyde dehydrogenase